MKRIEAWVQRCELEDVAAALREAGVAGATATEVRSVGNRVVEKKLFYRGASYRAESLPRVKLEMVVHDDAVERVISALVITSRTALVGDWEVIVLPVDDAVRIRTGEIAEAAIAS
jgi:nitrogen regulatory protein P-II 1